MLEAEEWMATSLITSLTIPPGEDLTDQGGTSLTTSLTSSSTTSSTNSLTTLATPPPG